MIQADRGNAIFFVAFIPGGAQTSLRQAAELKILARFPVRYFPPHSIPSLALPLVHDTGREPSKMLTPFPWRQLLKLAAAGRAALFRPAARTRQVEHLQAGE